jgi:hypothetical protein
VCVVVLQLSVSPMHRAHMVPPAPHAVSAVPLWQWPFVSQQPAGQLVESQTHRVPLQSWPGRQLTPLQLQSPPMHVSF